MDLKMNSSSYHNNIDIIIIIKIHFVILDTLKVGTCKEISRNHGTFNLSL